MIKTFSVKNTVNNEILLKLKFLKDGSCDLFINNNIAGQIYCEARDEKNRKIYFTDFGKE